MAMNIKEIQKKYNDGGYTCRVSIPDRVSSDHVFDEELSVRRNRELAQEHNDKVELMRKDKIRIQGELNEQFTNDVVEYIMVYYNLTEQQARMVESFVYKEHHSFMNDYFGYIDILADFAFMLLPPKGKAND